MRKYPVRDTANSPDIESRSQFSVFELAGLVEDISESLDCLYRASLQLSKRRAKDQFNKAAKIDTRYFERYDLEYCEERYPGAQDFLRKRMARILTKRRQYLKYREQHAAKLAQDIEGDGSDGEERRTALSETTATSFVETLTMDKPTDAGDTASIASDTTYSSIVGGKLRMPTLPTAAADGSFFQCPICRRMDQFKLPSRDWTKHVFRDLQPYFCTFSECETAEETFESRHSWWSHEVKSHRRQWVCRGHCNKPFEDARAFEEHIRTSKIAGVGPAQIPAYMDMCATAMDAAKPAACPFCDDVVIRGPKQLEKHIGRHMEETALFTLPQGLFHDDSDPEESSVSASSSDRGSQESERNAQNTANQEVEEPKILRTQEPATPTSAVRTLGGFRTRRQRTA